MDIVHEFLPLFLEWMPEVTPLQKSKPLKMKERINWTIAILLIYLVMSQVRTSKFLKLDLHTSYGTLLTILHSRMFSVVDSVQMRKLLLLCTIMHSVTLIIHEEHQKPCYSRFFITPFK